MIFATPNITYGGRYRVRGGGYGERDLIQLRSVLLELLGEHTRRPVRPGSGRRFY